LQNSSDNIQLTIKDLQKSDSGIYSCYVFNKDRRFISKKSFSVEVIGILNN
jgi:hypothetical protein